MSKTTTWRIVKLRLCTDSSCAESWSSESEDATSRKPTWKAVRYSANGLWYARLRVGGHKFSGEGPTVWLALDECRQKAITLVRELLKVVP